MRPASQLALLSAFAINFVAVGIPYWALPYDRVSVPDSLIGIGLAVVVIAALLLASRVS